MSNPGVFTRLSRLPARIWSREIVTYALLLVVALWSGLTVPRLVAVFLVESVVLTVFHEVLERQFSPRPMFTRLGQSVLGFVVLGGLAISTWVVARGQKLDEPEVWQVVVEGFSGESLLIGAIWVVLHLVVLSVFAWREPDRQEALRRSLDGYGISLLALVLQIFVFGVIGTTVVGTLAERIGRAHVEMILVTMAVLCRFVVAVTVRVIEHEGAVLR